MYMWREILESQNMMGEAMLHVRVERDVGEPEHDGGS